MLTRLYIKDFVLIREAEVEFGPGLNVVTGETGAGKSLIVGAVSVVLGGQASADVVRQGCDRCTVECLFEFAVDDPHGSRLEKHLASLDLPSEDGQVFLRREIQDSGRSRSFVNGLVVPMRKLRELGVALVDLHGQHEHQSLMSASLHAGFLDDFAGLTQTAGRVSGLYDDHSTLVKAFEDLIDEREGLQEEAELRQFQLDEIREGAPETDEEEGLENQLRVLENVEALTAGASELYELLSQADSSVVAQLARVRRLFERLVATDATLSSQEEGLDAVIYGAQDVADAVRDYLQRLEPRPERLEELRERLENLRRLKSKYGRTLREVVEFARKLELELDRSTELDEKVQGARIEAENCRSAFSDACLSLSCKRHEAAEMLSAAVEKGLAEIGMGEATFEIRLSRNPDEAGLVEEGDGRWRADRGGIETVEFFLAANAGEARLPLRRVASGGEISRIMLVLKQLIAEQDDVSTLLFDEIDAGISGRVAAAVGKKLEALSASHQTIVITHLPQIASLAHQHFEVSKQSQDNRTVTSVKVLDKLQRREEIARLLAGETVSDTARRHAEDMLR